MPNWYYIECLFTKYLYYLFKVIFREDNHDTLPTVKSSLNFHSYMVHERAHPSENPAKRNWTKVTHRAKEFHNP